MNQDNFIFPVYFDTAEGPDMHGNGFFIENYFVSAAHVVEEDPSVCSAPYIIIFGNKVFLNNENLLFREYTVNDSDSDTYEKNDAADIVVYKVNGINSPLHLAEKLPMSGQQLSCNFYHKKPLPEGNATNNHQSFLWRTTGVVQEFVPKVPNFFIAKMEPRHPFKGSSGSPLFKGDIVYGILHSGGDDICGFFATAYAVELLYHYTK
jgi:hypothetical protein